jgi:hypothetical protein
MWSVHFQPYLGIWANLYATGQHKESWKSLDEFRRIARDHNSEDFNSVAQWMLIQELFVQGKFKDAVGVCEERLRYGVGINDEKLALKIGEHPGALIYTTASWGYFFLGEIKKSLEAMMRRPLGVTLHRNPLSSESRNTMSRPLGAIASIARLVNFRQGITNFQVAPVRESRRKRAHWQVYQLQVGVQVPKAKSVGYRISVQEIADQRCECKEDQNGLKICCPQGRAGSSPARGTNLGLAYTVVARVSKTLPPGVSVRLRPPAPVGSAERIG